MKKIFSFLVVCLLSSMAMGVWAQDLPPGVKFSDGTNEYWYNISFNRYYDQQKYWLVDHEVSGALIHQVLNENSANFQWKFVLVPGETKRFYMVNRQYGEYVAHVDASVTTYTDTYGMQVPPELIDANGNVLRVDDSFVYYMDGDSKNYAKVFEFQYSPDQKGWGIIDTEITGTTHQALNDWRVLGRIVAVWDLNDPGSIVRIDPSGVPLVVTSTDSISVSSLVNYKSQATFTVSGRTLNSAITVAVEGADASAFTADPTTLPAKSGKVTVTFSPTELRAYEATIRISTPGTDDKLVKLTGEVYQQSDLPQISAEGGPEHWYYIQFQRRVPKVIAANSSATDPRVLERDFTTGAPDPNQMWKICGNWNDGYYLVNKANLKEMLYNTKDTTGMNLPAGTVNPTRINPDFENDRYYLPESGYGSTFDFVRFKTSNHWQLRNRDVSSDGGSLTSNPERRYVNEWWSGDQNNSDLMLHHWDKNDDGNEILFISADQPLIKTNPVFANLSAPVGETKTATVTVFGVGTTGDINISIAGAGKDKFRVDPVSLPAEGGDVTISFTSDSETEYYTASMTLSSAGAADVTVPLFGNSGGPIFSTPTQNVWSYIQFQRAAGQGKVVQSNGVGKEISQVPMVPGDPKQQWKLSGTKDGLVIENRAGGFFFYQKSADGTVPTSNHAIINETDGDLLSAVYDPNATTTDPVGGPGLWEFKLLVNNGNKDGVNDYNQNIVGLWDASDWNGNAVKLIPVESEEAHNPMLIAEASATNLAVPAGETANAKVTVTGTFLTGAITAALTGDDAANFSLSASTLPKEGGELTVTFAPTASEQGYKATLTLSSAGIKDVTVSFAGLTPPKFSTTGNEVWYFLQFERTANRNDDKKSNVWTSNGYGYEMAQVQKEDDYYAQQWKLVGDWKSEFVIESREGGQIFFDKPTNDQGVESAAGNALIGDAGDSLVLKQNGTKWEIQLAMHTDGTWGCLNDPAADGTQVGLWYLGDGGNYVKFIPVDIQQGIQQPSIDPSGQVVSMKFYTLQGIEVRKPAVTGVYIVKKVYSSGKTQAVKQLIEVK